MYRFSWIKQITYSKLFLHIHLINVNCAKIYPKLPLSSVDIVKHVISHNETSKLLCFHFREECEDLDFIQDEKLKSLLETAAFLW